MKTSLHEREHELGVLDSAVARVGQGESAVVIISGPAGIGKSALMASVRSRVPVSWQVFDSICSPLSPDISFGLVRDWFELAARRTSPGEAPYDGPATVLGQMHQLEVRTTPVPDLVYGIRWALDALTDEAPVLLLVDDLQWADASSLQVLDLVASQLPPKVLLLATRRTGEESEGAGPLARLAGRAEMLEPVPLTSAAIAAMIEQRGGDASEADQVLELTGGNPFLVHEHLHRGGSGDSSEISARLVDTYRARLDRHGAEATEVAIAVCLLRGQGTLTEVAEVAGLTRDETATHLATLARADIIDFSADGPRPTHPLVGDAVLARLDDDDRARRHRLTGNVLNSHGHPDAEVAAHWVRSLPGDDRQLRELMLTHGRAALHRGSPATAEHYLRRALAECPDLAAQSDLHADLGRALARLGRTEEAIVAFDAAIAHADDLRGRTLLLAESGDVLNEAGLHDRAAVRFHGAIDALDDDADLGARQLLVAHLVSSGAISSLPGLDPTELVTQVLTHPVEEDTPEERVLLAAASAATCFVAQDAATARMLALRADNDGALLREQTGDGTMVYVIAGSLHFSDAFADMLRICNAAVVDTQRRGSPLGFATPVYCRGYAHLRAGDLGAATTDFQSALDLRQLGWEAYVAPALSGLVECHANRGEIEAAQALVPDLEEARSTPGMLGPWAELGLALVHLAEGKAEQALAEFESVGRAVDPVTPNPAILRWHLGVVRSLTALRRHDQARKEALALLAKARTWGGPSMIALALRALAINSQISEREPRYREALDLALSCGAELTVANVRAGLGAVLIDSAPDEARDLLVAADRYALSQRVTPLLTFTRAKLETLGAVDAAALDPIAGLSSNQRRVVDLAVEGLSNREISTRLFVTQKTVEYHLSTAFKKLGINSRQQLAQAIKRDPDPVV